jgi:hypothetical protein
MADSNPPSKPRKETAKERKLILMREFAEQVSAGPTYTAAAKRAGISARTATRWQSNPTFLALARELERPTNDAIGRRARALVPRALARCERIIDSPDATDTDALKALGWFSKLNLEYSDRAELIAEIEDLQAENEALRARLKAMES